MVNSDCAGSVTIEMLITELLDIFYSIVNFLFTRVLKANYNYEDGEAAAKDITIFDILRKKSL